MEELIQGLLSITSDLGYWGIVILMVIESSFIPFPSELVIPPAAYLAYKGEMNIYLVILFGVLGSLIGAIFNYYLAMYIGRPLAYKLVEKKWAKYFLLSREGLQKTETYFAKYGSVSTFIGRLIPAVRQLISLPAGFAKMNIGKFLFYTTLGSASWVIVLAVLGYYWGANDEVLRQYYSEISWGILIVFVVFIVVLILRRLRKKRASI